ncbi:cytochrome b [Coralliovum pocilloporae]|uniref:cytochrome b n=1 Tax=Coralliovum pocilloporae TaxID=3066369 RepID=UPI0033074883
MSQSSDSWTDAFGVGEITRRKALAIRLLHWSVVVLFIVAFATAYKAFDFHTSMPVWVRDALFAAHRLSGMLAGLLLLIWLLVRLSAFIRLARERVRPKILDLFHFGLGIACFILPVLPWIARSQDGRTAELYSLLPTYNSMSPPTTNFVYKLLAEHRDLADIVLILLGIHIAGALFHRFVLKDRVMWSMWFGGKSG